MSTTLHEAIAAVRAGEMARAQLIAADIVRENPDDPNGWYLLSQLVDSDARRAAYLSKTLALDPTHARARIEFDSLPPALVEDLLPAGAATVADTVAEAEAAIEPVAGDTADWLTAPAAEAEAAIAPTTELPEVAVAAEAAVAGDVDAPPADVPEWLQPLGPKPVPPSAHLTPAKPIPGQPHPAAARKSAAARKKNSGNQALSILLGLLMLLTLLVLAFLVYLLFF
jgi:hypothetical protein